MSTNRQAVSDIISLLRANNIDDRVPYRFVLSVLRDSINNFVKQDSDNRRLFKQANLWITIPCVALKEIDLNECSIDVIGCETIRKSIIQIPETYATMYGQAIRIVNVKGSLEYKQIQQEDYTDLMNREFRDKRIRYFWIDDNYIYIPDSDVETIKIIGFFKKTEEVSLILNKSNGCIKPLDEEFKCPEYLLKIVKQDVFNTVLRSYGKPIDENPNLNSNEKTEISINP